jgi:hypothetical protein
LGTFAGLDDRAEFAATEGRLQINYSGPSPGNNGGLGTPFITLTAVPEPVIQLLSDLVVMARLLIRRSRPASE